ncbi:MAG TPA: ABC transporter substrate-binding protein [Usitatibacteraceae bacterium]|nr:ABC transporter substrate-binding protein [Usitatibacteraceae bacterium]
MTGAALTTCRSDSVTCGRREFLVGAFLVTISGASLAQAPGKVHVIGVLLPWNAAPRDGSPPPAPRWLDEALARNGFVVGRNVRIETAFGNVRIEREFDERERERRDSLVAVAARKLLALDPDVIFVASAAGIAALQALTKSVPIVFANQVDPVQAGFVRELRRPGGNVTGVALLYEELAEKRIELVRQLLPGAKRIALIADFPLARERNRTFPSRLEAAASRLGLLLIRGDVSAHGGDLAATLRHVLESRPDAFMAFGTIPSAPDRFEQFLKFEKTHRIPFIGDGAEDGRGVVSYGADYDDHFRRAAEMIVRILRGASPADTPVDRDTRFLLVVDLPLAKQIGIEIPPSILLRADRIIR